MFVSISGSRVAFVPNAMFAAEPPLRAYHYATAYVDRLAPISDVEGHHDDVNWHGKWLAYLLPGDTSPLLDSPIHLIRRADINNRSIPLPQMRRRYYEAYIMMLNVTRAYKRGNLLPALIRAYALAIKEHNTPALWRMSHMLTRDAPVLNVLLNPDAQWRYPKSAHNPYQRMRRAENNKRIALQRLAISKKRNAALKLRAGKLRAAANRAAALARLRRIVIN